MNTPDLHSPYTWAWIGWGLYFVVLEGIALARSGPGDTLTDHLRYLMAAHPVFVLVVAGLLLWLAHHLLVETWL